MIDRRFWEEVRDVWVVKAPPQIKDVKTSSGGDIDPSLLQDPWDCEEISFDMVDFDHITKDILKGGDIPLKQIAPQQNTAEAPAAPEIIPEPEKPKLDTEAFDAALEKQTIPGYMEACKLLIACELSEDIDTLLKELAERMQMLQDAIKKFEDVYQPDMMRFYEYYAPEALQVMASYLEYRSLKIDEQIVQEAAQEAINSAEKLLLCINDIIDETYRFASIEVKARSKALDSIMSMDGHVEPSFKIK